MAAAGVNTALNAVKRRVFVVGVGMTKFEKPGRRENFDYPEMAKEAGTKALSDAGVSFDKVEQACVGYCYGDTTSGQNALYKLGLTGIPVYNVNNACSTGSTALFMAKQLVEGGLANCVMALGFEKMERGSLGMKYTDRANPMESHMGVLAKTYGIESSPFAAQMFGSAGKEHMKKYGTKPEHFAKIAYKNHKHSVNNPYSQFRDVYTLEQIQNSPMIHEPLTKLQCCPTSDGSAAAIIGSEEFVMQNGLQDQAIEIIGMSMTTDTPSSFQDSVMKMVGYDMAKRAAEKVYKQSGLGPEDVQVVELHDCFATNELITYEALGLCEQGKAGEMVDKGDNTYGGKYVVNPSGGLISKGHPLGATGLAQCSELCWQLRGMADKRQVPGAKVALQHNLGLGGAAVVTMYRHGFPETQQVRAIHTSARKSAENTFLSYPVFESIKSTLSKDGANMVKKVKGTYNFVITGPEGKEATWFVDVKNGHGSVSFGSTEKAECTISVADQDLLNMATGKLDSQQAFFSGQLKVSGNMSLAMKLRDIMPKLEKSKL